MGPLTRVTASPGLVYTTALSQPPGLGISRHFDVTHRVATRPQPHKEMLTGTHPAPQPVWRDQSHANNRFSIQSTMEQAALHPRDHPSTQSFYFLGEFRIAAVRRGAGEIKSLGIRVTILHSIWIALHSFESISHTCEHLSSSGRKGRKTERSLFTNEETGALRNSMAGPKSPTNQVSDFSVFTPLDFLLCKHLGIRFILQ